MNETAEKVDFTILFGKEGDRCWRCGKLYAFITTGNGRHGAWAPDCLCIDKVLDGEKAVGDDRRAFEAFMREQLVLDDLTNREYLSGDFSRFSFDTIERPLDGAAVIRRAEWYTGNIRDNVAKGRAIGFIGPTGTGKSVLMVCLHRAMEAQVYTTAILDMKRFFQKLKEKMGRKSDIDETLRHVERADVLFLDNLFSRAYKKWEVDDVLHRIVEHRNRNRKPMFFTSTVEGGTEKQKKEEMTRILGGTESARAVVDLLFCSRESETDLRMGRPPRVTIIEMGGESWR